MALEPTLISSNRDKSSFKVTPRKTKSTSLTKSTKSRQLTNKPSRLNRWGHIFTGVCAVAAAIATGTNCELGQIGRAHV